MPQNAWGRYKAKYRKYDAMARKAFAGDTRPFSGSATSRFGKDGTSMGCVSTGCEIGRDLIPWWQCYAGGDKPSKENASLRGILCGNFVYIPTDKDSNFLPYDTPKDMPVEGYYLFGFGSPENKGFDAWTLTGNPAMPIKLGEDGKSDGAIIMLSGGP